MKFSTLVFVFFAAFAATQTQLVAAGPDATAILNIVWANLGALSRTIVSNLQSGAISSNYSSAIQEASEIYINASIAYAANISSLYLSFVQNDTVLYGDEVTAFVANLTANLTATIVPQKIQVITNLFSINAAIAPNAAKLATVLKDLNEIQIPAIEAVVEEYQGKWKTYATGLVESAVSITNNDTKKVAIVQGLANNYVSSSTVNLVKCSTTAAQNIWNFAAKVYNSISRYTTATLGLEASVIECLLSTTTGAKCVSATKANTDIIKPAQTVIVQYTAEAINLNNTGIANSACVVTANANFELGKIKLNNQILAVYTGK